MMIDLVRLFSLGRRCRKRVLHAFGQAADGSTTIMFGLVGLVLFYAIGLAVDYNRWHNARGETLSALDSAVLAGGRVLQTGGSEADAISIARAFYANAVTDRLRTIDDTITFKVIENGLAMTAEGNAAISTPFMAIGGVRKLNLVNLVDSKKDKTKTDRPVARIAAGPNSDFNIETSVMLDVSGSMSGQKIEDLKEAAKDLVNIIVWQDQSANYSKVALVPFSGDVRPPADILETVTKTGAPFSRQTPWARFDFAPSDCVGERGGDKAFTDDVAVGDNVVTRAHHRVFSSTAQKAPCIIRESAEVMPLTSNRNELIDRITGLEAGGLTAGHVGTAWTAYMLSPQWASALKGDARPASYGRSDVRKIMILMTDGEYNSTYDSDQAGSSAPGGSGQNGAGSINGMSSSEQAVKICQTMRGNDVEIYTVGFELQPNSVAMETLRRCASDPGNVYLAENGEDLKSAFRDIALRISALYLSQ